MALSACQECGHQVSDQAASCPSCGAPVRRPEPQGLKRNVGCGPMVVVALVLGALFVWILSAMNPEPDAQRDARRQDQRAIEYCQDQYEQANSERRFSPAELQLMHGACEHLRSEYRKKWRREP